MKFKIKAKASNFYNSFLDTKEYKELEQIIKSTYNQCFNDGMITLEEFLNKMKELHQKFEFYDKHKMFEPEDYED